MRSAIYSPREGKAANWCQHLRATVRSVVYGFLFNTREGNISIVKDFYAETENKEIRLLSPNDKRLTVPRDKFLQFATFIVGMQVIVHLLSRKILNTKNIYDAGYGTKWKNVMKPYTGHTLAWICENIRIF